MPRSMWSDRSRCELCCREHAADDSGLAQGERSWFRPGQVLVDGTTARLYADSLVRDPDRHDFGFESPKGLIAIDLVQVHLDAGTDVIDLVAWIRADAVRRDVSHRVVVGPNYAWRGEPIYHGGPGGEPRPADARKLQGGRGERGNGKPCDIATLDTGIVEGLPPELMGCLQPDANDTDTCDVDGDGLLDTQNGHGSFVAGIVHQQAPELIVDPGKVLDSTGVGDDASVTRELLQTTAPVVNMSLGGYTEDDRAPVAMTEVVRALAQTTVMVAAAGNNASDRPFWPAAFKGVLAVAAYDSGNSPLRPASFSNYGSWVDVCAPGVGIISTFATFPTDPKGARKEQPVFRGWASWDGTSFAAPQVAAALAQLVKNGASPREAVTLFLEKECSFEPALADHGLVYRPRVQVT